MTDNNAPADDVVARLREVERFYSTMHEQSGVAKVAAKAAAEIERLRAERAIVDPAAESFHKRMVEAEARVRELEDGLRPFAFGGMTWLHGNKVMIKIDTAAIERARALIERNSK